MMSTGKIAQRVLLIKTASSLIKARIWWRLLLPTGYTGKKLAQVGYIDKTGDRVSASLDWGWTLARMGAVEFDHKLSYIG